MSTSALNMPSAAASTSPKVNFSHAKLSSKYLDPSQPPTKGVPFQHINNIPFAKCVGICMPASVRESLYSDATTSDVSQGNGGLFPALHYAKVVMTLKDILDDQDLRRGNYFFLSAPKSPSSNSTTISLTYGKLIIDMPLHVYQRAGLTFPASKIRSGGRKHNPQSARYRIETDLRQPSMVKGKKGFDRLMYAAKNVEGLNEPRTWLFYDMHDVPEASISNNKKRKWVEEDAPTVPSGAGSPELALDQTMNSREGHPLSKFNPSASTTGDVTGTLQKVIVPSFVSNPKFFSSLPLQAANQQAKKAGIPTILEEDIYDVIEYLSLLFLQSPRITKAEYGKIDPYLCQYALPDISSLSDSTSETKDIPEGMRDDTGSISVEDLNTISYSGLIPPAFVTQLLVDIIRRSRSIKMPKTANVWVAVNIVAHQTDVTGSSEGLMLLLQAGDVIKGATISAVTGDTTMIDERLESLNTGESEPESVFLKGLHFATCFEFVDSSAG